MQRNVLVNGYDLRNLGFVAEPITGPWDRPEVQDPTAQVPGRGGAIVVSSRASSVQSRRIEIPGHIIGDTLPQRDIRIRQLAGFLGNGLVELMVAASSSIIYFARLVSITESPYPKQYRAGRNGSRFSLVFECRDPWGYDASAITTAFLSSATALALGQQPSAGVLILQAGTNPTFTYRASSGLSRCVMGFTITLGANDFLTIDCDAQTITKSLAGTVSNAMDTWTTTVDGFPVLDPADGDPLNDIGPTVEVSSGQGLLIYRRAW